MRVKLFGPEPAVSLAALRVVVPLMILVAPGFREGAAVAHWDPSRWSVPEGLGWFVRWVPIAPDLALAAQVLTAFCALATVVGLRAQLAAAGLFVGAFYLFSIAQLTGFVWHDMHLLWFAALLAASPCGDVLGVDATRTWAESHPRYAKPLVTFRLLLGAVYFFPGWHKVVTQGLGWAWSDNLREHLHWKWAQHGIVPDWRIDQVPGLLEVGGTLVLAFELGFPVLVFIARARLVAVGLGIGFHLASEMIFRIPFLSLWICYVALVDWRPMLRRLRQRFESVARWLPDTAEPTPAREPRGRFGAVLVGLVLAASIQGARGQMSSYPFACYPTFQWRPGSAMPDLMITAVDDRSREREVLHARDSTGYRTQRQWAELWSLAGVWGDVRPEALTAYYRSLGHRPRFVDDEIRWGDAREIRFYRADRLVAPEARNAPPERRRLLLRVAIDP